MRKKIKRDFEIEFGNIHILEALELSPEYLIENGCSVIFHDISSYSVDISDSFVFTDDSEYADSIVRKMFTEVMMLDFSARLSKHLDTYFENVRFTISVLNDMVIEGAALGDGQLVFRTHRFFNNIGEWRVGGAMDILDMWTNEWGWTV